MATPSPNVNVQLSMDDITRLLGQRDVVIYQLQQELQRLQLELAKLQEQLASK